MATDVLNIMKEKKKQEGGLCLALTKRQITAFMRLRTS